MDCYSALKGNEVQVLLMTFMNLLGILLCEKANLKRAHTVYIDKILECFRGGGVRGRLAGVNQ